MNRFNRWALIAAALLLAAGVFAVAYNVGVAHGIEQGGKTIAQAPGTAPVYPYPYYGHGHWGFPFFFVPLFFLAFWLLIARAFFWRGGWHRGGCDRFDDWHRRAHERMAGGQGGSPVAG
ncbi:MAG: hypothetical protein ACM369_00295 [Acidobacteriota bacterium]